MADATTIVVSATVVTDDPQRAGLAIDALSRAIAVLGVQGVNASLSVGHPDDEGDEGE